MGTILLTGFEPFANTPVNRAELVARHLVGQPIDGANVVALAAIGSHPIDTDDTIVSCFQI